MDFSHLDIPCHIGIIMDGNGRWAKKRFLPRVAGHWKGMQTIRRIVKLSTKIKLKYLSLYAFSVENWKRSDLEVEFLMQLMDKYLSDEIKDLNRNNVRLNFTGRINELNKSIRDKIDNACRVTSNNTGVVLNLVVNYSGRCELVDACRKLSKKIRGKKLKVSEIDENLIAQNLYTKDIPDPDLLIRTSGEQRISNFFLWQIAQTSIWVTPVFWPAFTEKHFYEALVFYNENHKKSLTTEVTEF
jgi:undecaprenyl diphosphate synthase